MKKAIILLLLANFTGQGQNINPEEDEIYREGEVAVIKITMAAEDKTFLLDDENVWSDQYLRAEIRFTNSILDTLLTEDVGIRLRGNTSRTQPKRSFKIKFKEFEGGKFYGYKKFNLKAENNDPSMVREMLAMQTFRNANVAATRTHHAEVFINDEYMGIYLNVEQLDDGFIESRFNSEEGNLYKCTWPAILVDNGDLNNNDTYELKTNKSANDRTILTHFVDVLNNSSDEVFQIEIEKVFNVQPYIRYLAVEALLGHWDGYSYNKNNYYLYENPENGLIEFMPYDTDNTFGIDWVDRDWANRDVLDWATHGEIRPLTNRILEVQSYYWMYVIELEKLINTIFNENALFVQFDEFKNRLRDAVARDTYFSQTFGATFQDFIDSYDTNDLNENTEHLPYGLKPYVSTRVQTAQESLSVVLGLEDLSKSTIVYPNPSNGSTVYISSLIEPVGIYVYSVQGLKMEFSWLKKGNTTYQLEFDKTLPLGLYFLYQNGTSTKFLVY